MSIERAGGDGRFRVSVDGEAAIVEARRSGAFGLSLLFPDDAHASTRLAIAPGPPRANCSRTSPAAPPPSP